MAENNQQVVVITGASSGIGRAAAHEFAAKGAQVVLASRQLDELNRVAEEVRAAGGEALAVETDVSDRQSVERLAQQAVERFGRIDVWVNNAAVAIFGRFEEIPEDDFRKVIETNLFGYIHGARAALPHFRSQGYGSLINVSSIVGKTGQAYTAPYTISKSGILGLTESLRQELVDEPNISVSAIIPATIDTPLFHHAADFYGQEPQAMPPVYPATDVAKKIVRVATRPKPEVYVGFVPRKMRMMHAMARKMHEKKFEKQVRTTHFKDEPLGPVHGNLYEPDDTYAAVSGGWPVHTGRKRGAAIGAAAGAAGLAGALAWLVVRRRRSSAQCPPASRIRALLG